MPATRSTRSSTRTTASKRNTKEVEEEEDDIEEEAPKKTTRAVKKAPVKRSTKKKVEDDDDDEEEAPPKKTTKRSAAAKKKEEKEEEEEGEDELEEEAPPKKSTKRSANSAKGKTDTLENDLGLKWEVDDTFYALDSDQLKPSSKVVAFDMDATLVHPKSGAAFPKSRSDWVWFLPEIPEKLKELNKEGFKIVIFTNQGGIEKNKQNPSDIKGKIIDIAKDLGFPIQAFVAAATDEYRKPNTTMFKIFEKKYNGGIELDRKVSLYVGDAAGRAKGWKQGRKKDIHSGDRAFGHNIKLNFKTPEEFFLGEKESPFEWESIDPAEILKKYADKKRDTSKIYKSGDDQEMVLMVGRPASGKSSFAKKYFVSKGYTWVNQDVLGTKPKCVKACKEALDSGKSVVIDNTNGKKDVRAEWISMAKSKNIPVRCFLFETDLELCSHLNFYRGKVTNPSVRRIPDVAYHTYKKYFEEPTTSEGFTEVNKMDWVPEFENDEHKDLFLERTA